MINTIIFDIGMVLADFCWQDYLKSFHFEDAVYRQVAEAMFLSSTWQDYDRSAYPDEEILRRFVENAPTRREEINSVFDTIGATVKCYDYTVPWIHKLKKKGYKIYFLSNYAAKTFEQTKDELSFLKDIDGGIFSFQLHQVKPEPAIYHSLITKYQIQPEHSVFLDDSQSNLDGAKVFGFHTILFHDQASAIEELKTLGIDA